MEKLIRLLIGVHYRFIEGIEMKHFLIKCRLFLSILEVGKNNSSTLNIKNISVSSEISRDILYFISSSQNLLRSGLRSVRTSHSIATCLARDNYL